MSTDSGWNCTPTTGAVMWRAAMTMPALSPSTVRARQVSDGELDTCIVIRSAFVTGGRALVQAGAGVVADSVPAMETAETVHKASAVLTAIAAAQGADLIIDPGSADSTPGTPAPETGEES